MPEITKTIKDAVKELRALQAELGEDQKELSGINEELTGIEEAKEKNKKKGKTKTPKPVVHKQKSLPPKKEEVFDLDKEIAEAKARIDAGIEKNAKESSKILDEKIDELRVETKEKISALEEKYLSGKEAEDFESKDGVNYYPKETEKEMQELEASLVKSREEYLIAKRKKPGFFGKLFRKFDKALNSESEEYTLKKEKPTREFIEKEKAYFEIQKAYLEKSGIDVTDFTRDEKIKVKAYELEHASLPEKIKNGVNNGIEYWEKIGENEKDHPFTRRLKKTCKKMISIAVIGGASAVTVSALSGTLVATAGTIATYVGGKMLISGGFGIIAGSLPPEVQAVASTIATGMSAMSVSGLIGYLASKAAESGHDEKSIQEELERRLQELKNTKIEGESLEDKIKRTSKDHDEIIKWAEKQRRFRRIISATTALVAGAATYELGSNTAEASAYTEAQHENIENIAPVQEQEFNDSTVEVASQVDEVPLHEQEVTEEHVENNENIANQESVDTEIQDNTDAGIEPEAKIETVNENETVSVENTNVEHETTEIPVNADENLTDAEYNEKYPIHSNDEELSRYQYDSEGNPMHHTNETIDTHTANEPAQESTSSLIDNDSYHLKPEVLTLYNENAEHILKATGHSDWQELVNSRSAEDIMSLKEQYTPEDLSPLVQYMHKLQEVTGLEPRGEDLLSSAETGEHYVARALERAEQISVLDQVKL